MKKMSVLTSLLVAIWLSFTATTAMATTVNSYGLPDFTELVEQNNQVVVNISTTKKIVRDQSQSVAPLQGMPEELLRYFFGIPGGDLDQFRDRFGGKQPGMPQKQQQSHSLGSGFVISADGYILTNHHVIDGADEIIVRMRNRKELKAKVIGSDPRTDVALLKISAKDLPFAKIGSLKDLKVGQWVLAIGQPFGLDHTVTHGIISALGRALPEDTYVPFIQTDIAINPGNSGGPLFNLEGEVIGINSMIYSKSGGAMGLSFSIPIDIAMNVVDQLKHGGKVVRGYLGVQVQEVTSELSKSFGLVKPMGALVGETFPATPAAKAGIEPGDIILEFDGKEITKSSDLPPIVGVTPIDKKVDVKLLRQGKEKTIRLKLASLDKSESVAAEQAGHNMHNLLGAEVEVMDKADLSQLKIPFGVRVVNVFAEPALSAGLRQGDVIVTIDFKPVKNIQILDSLLKSLPKNRSVAVRILREGHSLFLPLILDK